MIVEIQNALVTISSGTTLLMVIFSFFLFDSLISFPFSLPFSSHPSFLSTSTFSPLLSTLTYKSNRHLLPTTEKDILDYIRSTYRPLKDSSSAVQTIFERGLELALERLKKPLALEDALEGAVRWVGESGIKLEEDWSGFGAIVGAAKDP